MPTFHIAVSSASRDQIIALRRVHKVRVIDHGAARDGDILTVQAIADSEVIRSLEDAGYTVAVYENLDEPDSRSRAQVGEGNRFLEPPEQEK